MADYYLWRNSQKNGTYYVELLEPETGLKYTTRSTKTADYKTAVRIVEGWLVNGVPAKGKRKTTRPALKALKAVLDFIKATPDLDAAGAEKIAEALRRRGLLDFATAKGRPGREGLLAYLKRFWNPGKSPYLRDKEAHGKHVGKNHVYLQNLALRKWEEFFGEEKLLEEVTRGDLREFGLWLHGKGLSAASITNALKPGTVALGWAAREGIIDKNPAYKLPGFSGKRKKRDILSLIEIELLFKTDGKGKPIHWKVVNKRAAPEQEAVLALLRESGRPMTTGEVAAALGRSETSASNTLTRLKEKKEVKNPKYGYWKSVDKKPDEQFYFREYAGCLLAAETGMRSGEVLALRRSVIEKALQTGIIEVENSYNPHDGLKGTKSGESRKVPLLSRSRAALVELLKENPYSDPDAFVFYSERKKEPMSGELLRKGLYRAIESAGIVLEGRNICVHSFRHSVATYWGQKMDNLEQLREVLGHKSEAVNRIYRDHVTMEALAAARKAGEEVFGGNILQFPKPEGQEEAANG